MGPGEYLYVHENDHPIRWSANAYGWRDQEWTVEKPQGVLRVAMLGDSYVEALQVESEKTFSVLTEKALTQTLNRPVEVMNFGRSCFTQTEELLVLKNEILKFSPDLVVLFFFPINDIGDVHPKTALSVMRPFYSLGPFGELLLDTRFKETREFKLKTWINPLKRHSAFISLLAERFIRYQGVQQAKKSGILDEDNPDVSGTLRGYLSLATSTPDPQYAENYKLSKRLITEMQEICKQHGIHFVLVNIDLPSYIPDVEQKFKKIDPSFNTRFYDQDLEQFSKSLNIPFIGLEKIFSDKYLKTGTALHFKYWDELGTKGYWEYGAHTGHWNEQGHQLVAGILSPRIQTLLFEEKNLPKNQDAVCGSNCS